MVFLFIITPFSAVASVEISEVAWMGTTDSSTNEWVELHATSNADLTGWVLETKDGGLTITLSGSIASSGYYLIERTDDTTVPGIAGDLVVPFGSGLANGGEILILKDASGLVADEVDASGGWLAGDNTTKETMQRAGSAWITATATPKASSVSSGTVPPNESAATTTSATASSEKKAATDSSWQPYVPPEKLPRIKVFAGDDQRVVAGEELRMEGNALGFVGESLPNARYIWNFGNSIVKEGRSVSYIYPFPGTYTVRLSVVSGEHAAFDDALVRVGKNSAVISEIMPQATGWIELHNKGAESINLSGWMLQEASTGKRFVLPDGTRIAAQSFIVFENAATKIILTAAPETITLSYPNGMQAGEMIYAMSAPQGMSVVEGDSGTVLAYPTPGEANGNTRKIASGKTKDSSPALTSRMDVPMGQKVLSDEDATPVIEDKAKIADGAEYKAAAVLQKSLQERLLQSNLFWLAISAFIGLVAGGGLVFVRRRLA